MTCLLTWRLHANTPWPCDSHVAQLSFCSPFQLLHNGWGLNASKMHGTHSPISGEWKGNKRKHSPYCSGRAVRVGLIRTVAAAAKGLFCTGVFIPPTPGRHHSKFIWQFLGLCDIVQVNAESFVCVSADPRALAGLRCPVSLPSIYILVELMEEAASGCLVDPVSGESLR